MSNNFLKPLVRQIIFTEEFCQPENLYPFTLTRQMQDIRVGILTIREKWENYLELPSFDRNENDYKDLRRAVHVHEAVEEGPCLLIQGNVLPTPKLVKAAKRLKNGEFISLDGRGGIIFRVSREEIIDTHKIAVTREVPFREEVHSIHFPWDITRLNDWAIRQDFELLTKGKKSAKLSKSNKVIGKHPVFLETGAVAEHAIFNTTKGPIYLGRGSEVMEGSLIRGPFALGEGAVVKMGAKIYPATSIGPYSIVAGEIKNAVIFGYSNKAHDGYLGDAVIGEWCNMGAGTTNSNMKNNAGIVRIWTRKGLVEAGNKCGVMMGDYSRTAINTSINTGTVIGVSCNVFGSGLTPKYIPDFSWGSEGIARYELEKAYHDAEGWKQLKGHTLSDDEKTILQYIFEHF